MSDYTESLLCGAAHLLLFGAGVHFLDVESYILGGAMILGGAINVLLLFRCCYIDGRAETLKNCNDLLDRAAHRISQLEREKAEAEKMKHLDKP